MTFLCSGNNIYVPSFDREKDVAISELRDELYSVERKIIYRADEVRGDVVEQLWKVRNF